MRADPYVHTVRVYWEDTDAGGVVYHANYLKFLERGRSEWLRSLGWEQDRLRTVEKVIFVVRSAHIDYLAPARYNDKLEVRCAVAELGRASLVLAQTVERAGVVLTRAAVTLACVHSEHFKPVRIPGDLSLSLFPDHAS